MFIIEYRYGGLMKRFAFLILFIAGFMFVASAGFSTTYVLHLNGMCSTHWLDGKSKGGVSRLANAPGYVSVNCYVDNNNTIAYSASQFKTNYLDVYCKGSNWCYIVNYSAGDAIVGYINANYTPQWNIAYVYTTAGAGGGSEISISGISDLFTCNLGGQLGVSTIRNMYNHNDTNGITIYHIGGYKGIFGASVLLPGEDDGAVAYHSSAACVNSGSYNNLCNCTHWTNHVIAYTCSGYYLNHYEMKMKFITQLGW
jgi:hypothetical protein